MTEQMNNMDNMDNIGQEEINRAESPQEEIKASPESAKYNPPPVFTNLAVKEKEQPPRRVGTITMGLCLILCGAGLCAYLVYPFKNIEYILRFAPLVLVGLGIEILIANATCKNRKLKYDFLSIFIFVILIGASICATVFSVWIDYFSPKSFEQRRLLQDELYSFCYEQLEDEPVDTLTVQWDESYPYLNYYYVNPDTTLDEIKSSSELGMQLNLKGKYESKSAFAKKVKEIVQKLNQNGIKPGSIDFWSESADGSYRLWLNGWFQQGFSAEELAENIVEYNAEGEQIQQE